MRWITLITITLSVRQGYKVIIDTKKYLIVSLSSHNLSSHVKDFAVAFFLSPT